MIGFFQASRIRTKSFQAKEVACSKADCTKIMNEKSMWVKCRVNSKDSGTKCGDPCRST